MNEEKAGYIEAEDRGQLAHVERVHEAARFIADICERRHSERPEVTKGREWAMYCGSRDAVSYAKSAGERWKYSNSILSLQESIWVLEEEMRDE